MPPSKAHEDAIYIIKESLYNYINEKRKRIYGIASNG
jgi:hypothetical protein